jgi:hypothetical protein
VDLVALELVDAGLLLVSSRGTVSPPSPGLALIDGDEITVGQDAECVARLTPRRLHSRFWQDLGISPLGRPFPGHLRSADLAHAHLKSIWESSGREARDIVVAVPGVYTEYQLALLLGIARDLEIPVCGLVDAAVAATADRETEAHCIHLDIHLHRVILTELANDEEIVVEAVDTEPAVGLWSLRDLWAQAVARAFVRAIRFDPLHLAATEQVLYAQLGDLLASLKTNESTEVCIPSGGRRHVVDIDRSVIINAARPAYEVVSSMFAKGGGRESATIFLSHRADSLPGLADHLSERTGLVMNVLHPAAAASGALAHVESIRSPGPALPFVTRLPRYDARPPRPVTVPVNPPPDAHRHPPTHLVIDGVARRLGPEPLILGLSGVEKEARDEQRSAAVRRVGDQVVIDAPSHAGVTISGEPLEGGAVLNSGDQVSFEGSDMVILAVTLVE